MFYNPVSRLSSSSMRLHLKNTQYKKWAGRMAQVVKYLPNKHKALSSNSSTMKKMYR
jgi:hypothetical protein